MRLRYGRPVKSKKKLITIGDEAVVSRLRTGPYAGMVERIQKLITDSPQAFFLKTPSSSNRCHVNYSIYPDHLTYHVFKFLSLGYANSVMPGCFVYPQELRVFQRKSGKSFAMTYSDFIPDESGVIKRKKAAMRRFYQARTKLSYDIRVEVDKHEHKSNPKLKKLVKRAEEFGLFLGHPEANYHLCGGKTVIFEIDGINIWTALNKLHSYRNPKGYAISHLSILFSLAIKYWAYNYQKNRGYEIDDYSHNTTATFSSTDFNTLYGSLYLLFSGPNWKKAILEWDQIIKSPIDYWGGMAMRQPESQIIPLSPLSLDPFFDDLLSGKNPPRP